MFKYVATALLLTLPVTQALAQYQGPGSDQAAAQSASSVETTVAEIKADPKDDMKVRLEGRLISKSGKENYVFADATGEIAVEIDDDDLPNEPVTADTIVIIDGEVDTHRIKDADIDADRVTIKK